MSYMDKIAQQAAAAVEKGVDMTVAKQGGGGEYVPPAAGYCRLRFVAYVELGKHERVNKGQAKTTERVRLVFELSGKNHPPKVTDDGTKVPMRITIEENLSLNEKANFYKLFTRMNYKGTAKHMAQLLGEAYTGTVVHDVWKTPEGQERTLAKLRDDTGYTIKPPRVPKVDPETGEPTSEFQVVAVDPPLTEIKAFFWQCDDLDLWNSIYIEGEYQEEKDAAGKVTRKAKSKNEFQNKIKLAKNFVGSPVHALLLAGGKAIDIPDAESGADGLDDGGDGPAQSAQQATQAAPQGAAAVDALNGIV